jgi:tetratricopeptide (TPR) repeat protein
LWAGRDVAKWGVARNGVVVHRGSGAGLVTEIYRDSDGLWVVVQYQTDDVREYLVQFFASTFRDMSLSGDMAKKILREAGAEYAKRLGGLSEKIERGLQLKSDDLLWLGAGGHIQELERYLQVQGDGWSVAQIGSFWRSAGVPERNLDATAGVLRSQTASPQDAAVWTTRGAALADLERMQEAEDCARRAAAASPESYYPYNLLGRIYGFLERPSDSEAAFARAKQLGAPEAQMLSAEKRGRHGRKRHASGRPVSGPRRAGPDSGAPEEEEEVPF